MYLSLKDTDKPMDVSNISGFLSCDNHKQEVANIFNAWRNDSYNYITNITKIPRERALTRKRKQRQKYKIVEENKRGKINTRKKEKKKKEK